MVFRLADTGLTVMLISFMFSAGCGMGGVQGTRGTGGLPLSNSQMMEKAVLDALENARVPESNAEIVRLEFKGNESPAERMLTVLVPGFLKNIGYEVTESDATSAVFLVRADLMAVTLNRKRGLWGRDGVTRRADASLVLEKRGRNGIKSVFRGSSTVSDGFSAAYLPAVGNDNTFVTVHDTGSFLSGSHGKPLVLGITMTALAWLLYAYRG